MLFKQNSILDSGLRVMLNYVGVKPQKGIHIVCLYFCLPQLIIEKFSSYFLSLSEADLARFDRVHSDSSNVIILQSLSPFILSSAKTSPLFLVSSLGLSIWFGSPSKTNLEPSPALFPPRSSAACPD